MRWLVLLLMLSGCASAPILLGSNWERICYDSPYADHQPIPAQVIQWLHYEGAHDGFHGWQVTPDWLNANCEVVPGAHQARL